MLSPLSERYWSHTRGADRVQQERRADLGGRDGKLMSLFFLSKIVGPHAYEEDPLLAEPS